MRQSASAKRDSFAEAAGGVKTRTALSDRTSLEWPARSFLRKRPNKTDQGDTYGV